MELEKFDLKADALEAYLSGERNVEGLSPEDSLLAGMLLTSAAALHPDPHFVSSLGDKLEEAAGSQYQVSSTRRKWGGFSFFKLSLSLAGAVLLAAILYIWLPPLMAPQKSMAVLPSQKAQTRQPGSSAELPLLPLLKVGQVQAAEGVGDSFFDDAEVSFTAMYPANPGKVTVYKKAGGEPLTPEVALGVAHGFGIDGKVYTDKKYGSDTPNYTVTDGIRRIDLIRATDSGYYSLNYFANYYETGRPANESKILSQEDLKMAAEEYLKAHLPESFTIQVGEVGNFDPFTQLSYIPVRRTASGIPLVSNLSDIGSIGLKPEGEVSQLNIQHANLELEPLGEYPLRSPQEAWNILLKNEADPRIGSQFSSFMIPSSPDTRIWKRSYTVGGEANRYGNLDLIEPAQAGGSPLLTVDSMVLCGDVQGLIDFARQPMAPDSVLKKKVDAGEINFRDVVFFSGQIHVWGTYQDLANEGRCLKVSDWELNPRYAEHLSGIVERVGDQDWLVEENGSRSLLPDLPQDVPLGERVWVTGFKAGEGPVVFEWSSISNQESIGGGGGGGGGGEGMVFDPSGSGDGEVSPEVVETPIPCPYKSGDKVEGLIGTLYIVKYKKEDGSIQRRVNFSQEPASEGEYAVFGSLVGDNLEGLDALNHLHVRVWGTYRAKGNGLAELELERYEKAYPEEKVEAWLGSIKIEKVGDEYARLFTTTAGKTYLLGEYTSKKEEDLKDLPAYENALVEGCILPEKAVEGYPIIQDIMVWENPGFTDLDGYQLQMAAPMELPVRPPHGEGEGKKQVTVDKVELVYKIVDLPVEEPGSEVYRYIQPMWVFSGSYAGGQTFSVEVQAVQDKYLKKE